MTAFPRSLVVSTWMENDLLYPPIRINRSKIPADIRVYGSMRSKNSAILNPDKENRYRFCGFPIGVNILPKFAATVINVTTRHVMKVIPALLNIMIPNGTNVIRATSFVINILLTKHKKTSVTMIPRRDLVWSRIYLPMN